MRPADILRQSLRQFRTQRLQSILIVVAVALGVGVVTAVAAFLDFGRYQQVELEASLFAREISVQANEDDFGAFYAPGAAPVPVREVGLVSDEPVVLRVEDLARAEEAAPSVDYAYVREFRSFSPPDDAQGFVQVYAVTQDYLAAAKVEVTEGNTLSESDFAEGRAVMLATPELARRLGLAGDPLGKEVVADDGARYTLIGLLPERGEEFGFEPEALVPYTPGPFGDGLRELTFAVEDPERIDEARAELETFARRTWGERVSVSSNDFGAASEQGRVVALVIAAFASLGLAVAALNIMNLMLARVLRRHREIGVARTLGATRGLIRLRFLAESLLLGLLGGVLGVLGGYGLLRAFSRYLSLATQGQSPELTLSPVAVLIGLALAALVSALFGLYPAAVAARVRVAEVLRRL